MPALLSITWRYHRTAADAHCAGHRPPLPGQLRVHRHTGRHDRDRSGGARGRQGVARRSTCLGGHEVGVPRGYQAQQDIGDQLYRAGGNLLYGLQAGCLASCRAVWLLSVRAGDRRRAHGHHLDRQLRCRTTAEIVELDADMGKLLRVLYTVTGWLSSLGQGCNVLSRAGRHRSPRRVPDSPAGRQRVQELCRASRVHRRAASASSRRAP